MESAEPRDEINGHGDEVDGLIGNGQGGGEGREQVQGKPKPKGMDTTARLLYAASQGDIEEVETLLAVGDVDVNAADYDGRTALHLASSEGRVDMVKALLLAKANVNPIDRWGNSPLADAQSYGSSEICRLLKSHGGVLWEDGKEIVGGVPKPKKEEGDEFEIDPSELDLTKSKLIGQGSFGEVRMVGWRGTPVAVKMMKEELAALPHMESEFRNEVKIWQKIRHPNIVQFLGAVTKSKPLKIVTEYLSRGDLHAIVRRKGPLGPDEALHYAADIARGMCYLHGHKPEPIIHRDLKPRNLLRDEAGHLKVADFGLSRVLKSADAENDPMASSSSTLSGEAGTFRYMAPEVFRREEYNTSADVYSFAIIVYEMFEGGQPFKLQEPEEVAGIYARGVRPTFKAKTYPPGLKELIQECWDEKPDKRPSFTVILARLEQILNELHGDEFDEHGRLKKPKSSGCCVLL